MTVKLSSLKANIGRETAGDWIDYPDWPGVAFKVSSLYLAAYTTARDLLYQRLGRVHKKGIPNDILMAELGGLFAKHLLHGWRGIDEDYSPERAAEIMTDPAFRDVIAAVQWCAGEVGKTEVEFVEDEKKI